MKPTNKTKEDIYQEDYQEGYDEGREDIKKEVLKLINKKQVEYNGHKDLDELEREVEKL